MGKERGITLIALIITIILLLILAGVVISLTLGEKGLFNYAKEAKEETTKETATEKINLKITTAQMNSYAEKQRTPTLKEVSLILKEDKEIEYVTETKQIASTKYEVGEEPSSIYTKLKDYSYEFEINDKLQLASIDGVKVTIGSNENEMKAYVLGEITSFISSKGQLCSQGYSSNIEYMTCEGGVEKDYLEINVLKDMDILICLQEAGRGSSLQRIMQINDTIVGTISLAPSGHYECETKVSAGDVIKITATGVSGAVRGTAISILGM